MIPKSRFINSHMRAPAAAQRAAEPFLPWRDIMTAEDSDDLIWLFDRTNSSIDGPRTFCASDVDWYTHWAPCEAPETSRVTLASDPVAGEAQRIFLVPTGEVYCGQETYTHHEDQPPVNTDNECLYAAPQASEAVRIIGVDLPQNGIAMARNAALDEAAALLENHIPVSHFVFFDSPEGVSNRIANRSGPEVMSEAVAAIRALMTQADKGGAGSKEHQ